jgi:hypothetical protein
VTLGDEEARRRGTQKTVLERKAPPTFDVLVEQEDRHLVGIHKEVAASVDDLLRGESPQREMRERLQDGSLRRWTERAPRAAAADGVGLPVREAPLARDGGTMRRGGGRSALGGQAPRSPWWEERRERVPAGRQNLAEMTWLDPDLARSAARLADRDELEVMQSPEENTLFRKRRIYPMGINRTRLEQAIRELGLPAILGRDERDADVILVLKNIYRKQPDRVDAAQASGVPVYVLRSSGLDRLREALVDIFQPGGLPQQPAGQEPAPTR